MDDVLQQRDAFAERLFGSMLGAVDTFTVYMGERLGLYEGLREIGPATSTELSDHTGTHERYVREWLEQQAVADIIATDNDNDPLFRRYSLPPGHAEVLLDRDSLAFLSPMVRLFLGTTAVMPQLLKAFREGGGVPWEDMGSDAYEAQSDQNRPVFLGLLGSDWLPQIPDVHEKLQAGGRVLDIGCGGGWACIGMALAYPNITVEGVDLDTPAIELARRNAADAGVADRVTFRDADAADEVGENTYDLITMLEMVHDMSFPVKVLSTARELLADGGSIVVMDEKVAHAFEAPGDDLERIFYGFSVMCCLPTAMTEEGAAGTGTVMRPDTLKEYAAGAGLSEFEILPIEHDFFRFYRLGP